MSGKVSVVLPVYNVQQYLEEALLSVVHQSYKNLEILVVNDGSSDGSVNIVRKIQCYDDRVVLIDRDDNRGLVYSLNEGIARASGYYIARMDADDICELDRIEKQVNLIEKEGVDIVGCDYWVMNDNGEIKREEKVYTEARHILMQLCVSVPFAHGSVLCKKKILQKYPYKDSSVEDYELWIRMAGGGVKFGNVPELLYKHRVYSESFSFTKRAEMEAERYKLARKYVKNNQTIIVEMLREKVDDKERDRLVGLLFLKVATALCLTRKTVCKEFFGSLLFIGNNVKEYISYVKGFALK